MFIVFVIGMVLLFLVLFQLSLALYRRSRGGWVFMTLVILALFLFLGRPIADFMDPLFLGSVPNMTATVVSGRELTVKGWTNSTRRIVLAGTRLPPTPTAQQAVQAELVRLLGEKRRVTLVFPHPVRRMPEPWPAIVSSNGVDVNAALLHAGLLLPDSTLAVSTPAPPIQTPGTTPAQPPAGHAAGTPTTPSPPAPAASGTPPPVKPLKSWELGLPAWGRYVLWVLAGFFGATSLGMTLNKRPGGLVILLVIAGLAIRSITLSTQAHLAIWPPIICLGMIVLFGGGGRAANQEYVESHPDSR